MTAERNDKVVPFDAGDVVEGAGFTPEQNELVVKLTDAAKQVRCEHQSAIEPHLIASTGSQ